MRGHIEASAAALRMQASVFTQQNLYFAVRRSHGGAIDEEAFDAALRARLARGPMPGLLPAPLRARSRTLVHPRNDETANVVLLVDRAAILDLLAAMAADGSHALTGTAVVCIDGSPAPLVARLVQRFRGGWSLPVLYLHDAATVVYPFAIEPLATLVSQQGERSIVYRDLGLPPLGASARRFRDPALSPDEPILHLEEIPPLALARYCAKAIFTPAIERPT
jgi:hypothetical protein